MTLRARQACTRREIGFERGRRRQAGAVIAELGVILPILLVVMLAGIDLGRLVYENQILTDLTREAAMLVSRGATANVAFDATYRSDTPLDVQSEGGIIISRVRRHNATDAQPWVFAQDHSGALTTGSRVGAVGGAAHIPNITDVAPGVTIMAVEIMHSFQPVFVLSNFGIELYPDVVYKAAYF